MTSMEFHVGGWGGGPGIRCLLYTGPPGLPTATVSEGCAFYIEKPVCPLYTPFFEKQSFEYCEELLCSNEGHFEGFSEVGNQDPCSWQSGPRKGPWQGLKRENPPLGIVVPCLCGGFLGTEISGHNKLTFTGVCCPMPWSCVAGVLAAASESQGGWHCPGPVNLRIWCFCLNRQTQKRCVLYRVPSWSHILFITGVNLKSHWATMIYVVSLFDAYLSVDLCGCLQNDWVFHLGSVC